MASQARQGSSQGLYSDFSADETTTLNHRPSQRYDGDGPGRQSDNIRPSTEPGRTGSIKFVHSNTRPPITASPASISPSGSIHGRRRSRGRGSLHSTVNDTDDSGDDDTDNPAGLGSRHSRSNRRTTSSPSSGRLATARKKSVIPEVVRNSWRSVTSKYRSIELENKGSVARDHLALERTFLAWVRTSLSFASIGIAVTQLFRLNTAILSSDDGADDDSSSIVNLVFGTTPRDSAVVRPAAESDNRLRKVGKPLGATFLGVAILTLFVGFHRYFESQHYVLQGRFPASRGSVILMAFVSASLIVSSLVIVLAIGAGKFET